MPIKYHRDQARATRTREDAVGTFANRDTALLYRREVFGNVPRRFLTRPRGGSGDVRSNSNGVFRSNFAQFLS
jgi:hypothetical protein